MRAHPAGALGRAQGRTGGPRAGYRVAHVPRSAAQHRRARPGGLCRGVPPPVQRGDPPPGRAAEGTGATVPGGVGLRRLADRQAAPLRAGRARVRRTVGGRGTGGVGAQPCGVGPAGTGGPQRGQLPAPGAPQPLLSSGGHTGPAGYARRGHRFRAAARTRLKGAPMFDPRRVGQDLEEARRTYGGRDWPATFKDRLTAPLPGFREIARIMRQGGFGVKDLSDAANIAVSRQDRLTEVHSGQTAVTWIGHATYVLQIGGLTILTDPVWSRKIPGVKPRLTPPGVPLSGVGHVDTVVILTTTTTISTPPPSSNSPATPPCRDPGCSAPGSVAATS